MAADFTQDSVLFFLQSSGGSAKNSDLLLHFKHFLQDPASRERNRELFKKFVNSVAIVKQVDGVSHVFLRKKFRGHVPGNGAGLDSVGVSAGNYTEPSGVDVNTKQTVSLTPRGDTETKPVLSAAGIVVTNHSGVETKLNLKQKQRQEVNSPDPSPKSGPNISPDPSFRPGPNISPDPSFRPGPNISLKPSSKSGPNISPDPSSKPGPNISPDPSFRPGPNISPDPSPKSGPNISPDPSFRPGPNISPDPSPISGPNISPDPSFRPGPNISLKPSSKSGPNISPDPSSKPGPNISPDPSFRPGPNISPDPSFRPGPNISPDPSFRPGPNISPDPSFRPGPNISPDPSFRSDQVRTNRSDPSFRPVPNISPDPNFRPGPNISPDPSFRPRPIISPDPSFRPAQVGPQVPGLSKYPVPDQSIKVGQQRPISTPSIVVRHQEPEPELPRGQGDLHQDPPPPPRQQLPVRPFRYRPSYKSAVSQDDDGEEEEYEEVPIGRGSAGEVKTLNAPVSDSGRTISLSSTCIIDPPASSSSSGKTAPQIYIQPMEEEEEEEVVTPLGPSEVRPGSVPVEVTPIRLSLPSEAQRCAPVQESAAHFYRSVGTLMVSGQGFNQSQRLSPSHVVIPPSDDRFYSSNRPSSGSSRTSEWDGSSEGLWTRSADEPVGVEEIQEDLPRSGRAKMEAATHHRANSKTTMLWHRSTGNLYDEGQHMDRLSPLCRSTDSLHDDQSFTPRVMPWHLSEGDLCDDRMEVESSEGSISSQVQLRSAVVRRLSSKTRNRMCRSLGTNLDQILQEEAAIGGSKAAQLDRLQLISSSLSLPFNMSSSSLSSCATPPRCDSPSLQIGREEKRQRRKNLTSMTSQKGQSLVPLEPREHVWMVKAAAGAWPDIYSLFREDKSLLNKQDFISGFTVLHWIAKHGDHRILNTLGYGVEKAGMMFDVNAKSTAGQTPLHVAAIHGHKNIIRLLVNKYNANVRLRDVAGKKPWQYLSNKSPEILEMLKEPASAAVTGGIGTGDASWQQEKQSRRRLRHHFSTASSGQKPLTLTQLSKVKRSTSIAAFLKQKRLSRFSEA